MDDGAVIERRWARNFELIQDQLLAVTALVGALASGKKQGTAASEAGHGGSGSSSSSSSVTPKNSDYEEAVRHGRDHSERSRRPHIPSSSNSSSSSDGAEKTIIDQIDAIKKGRRTSAFMGVSTEKELKEARGWSRGERKECFSGRNLPTRQDL